MDDAHGEVSPSLGKAPTPCLARGAARDIMSPAAGAAAGEEELESPREEVSARDDPRSTLGYPVSLASHISGIITPR